MEGWWWSDGLSFINFKPDEYLYLNITSIGSNLVEDGSECGFACLEIPSCFSYNLAALPDINKKKLCELLPSDKYNNTDKFIASPVFHHFSIPVGGNLTFIDIPISINDLHQRNTITRSLWYNGYLITPAN